MPAKLPDRIEDRIKNISDKELAFRGWTREAMRTKYERRLEEDERSPRVGEEAPDFALECLSAIGERTGQYLKLSSLRGKPVGLILGSYT